MKDVDFMLGGICGYMVTTNIKNFSVVVNDDGIKCVVDGEKIEKPRSFVDEVQAPVRELFGDDII